MARRADTEGKVFAATFKLAADNGWNRVSLDDIAAEAKVRLADVKTLYPSKRAILEDFSARVDEESLSEPADEGTARDRLFELLMRRFDALAPYKLDLERLSRRPFGVDPCTMVSGGRRLVRSMSATLEASDIGSRGPFGRLRAKGLTLAYLGALRTWLVDESEDLSQTMAVLDKNLRRAEGLAELCAGRGRPRGPEPEPEPEAA